jgi:hypothetical protein
MSASKKLPPHDLPMSLDLNDLLENWPHESGQIKVRKIMGRDGEEKIQLRLDLGLIQMETHGRPDGMRPKGFESLLSYHQQQAREAEAKGESYQLAPEDCGELQQEGIQYYHRYLSLFQLEDFDAVVRDTQRNLDLAEFVREHTDRDDIAWSFDQFVPYITMMNTRAKAAIELEKNHLDSALREIDKGREAIQEFYQEHEQTDAADKSTELSFLDEWSEELRAKRPISKIERMRREMESAIAHEAYERAAQLRDAIKALDARRAARPPKTPRTEG